jgi:glycosyltransferase involved in cell wall biosynthesis
MATRRLIVVGPLPPPVHGVTVSTSLVLANPQLRDRFQVEHVDTSDHRSVANLGTWDVTNMRHGVTHLGAFLRRLRGPSGTVYLPLSQNAAAFFRDSLFIHAAVLSGWRVAAHLRGGEFRAFYESQSPGVRGWIRFALSRLSAVAVMGSSLRGLFDGLVAPERIAVVRNGTPDLRPDGIPKRPSTVLFLSNLRARKGLHESVEAARLVLERHPSARFVFAGSWENGTVERRVRERCRPFGDRIRFLPPIDGERKRALLASSSIFLFPPVEPEGHPRVVLEAMSAGLPVVTTDRGAIAETVKDGEGGFVLPDPDPEQLAERTCRLLADPALRERMSAAARRRYLEEFTQERADRRLAEWLDGLSPPTPASGDAPGPAG